MRKVIVVGVCILLAFSDAFAQRKWTLRECIEYAIEHNIEIKQQALQVENYEIDLNTTKSSRLPDLNASIGNGYNFGRSIYTETNTYEARNSSNVSFGVSTSVPVFTGFRIPNEVKVREFSLLAAIENLKKAQENLELQVTSLYLDVLLRKELVRVYIDQAEYYAQQVERTAILVESGKVPLSQLYEIKSQYARAEMNITTSNSDLEWSLLNLAQALNIMDADNFDVVEPQLGDVIAENINSVMPPEQIYATAIGIKPHIKEAEYSLEASRKSLKVAQSGYYPTLNFGMGYNTGAQRVYNFPNQSFSDQMRNQASEYISLSLNIPIFNRFQVRNQVRSARLNITNSMYILDNTKLALYKEIQQAYQNVVSAQARYYATEKAYEAAAEAFYYAQERYEVGKSTVYEYNEAQTNLLSSRSEQIQAKYEFLFGAKILDFYRGRSIYID